MKTYPRKRSPYIWLDYTVGGERFRESSGVKTVREAKLIMAQRCAEKAARVSSGPMSLSNAVRAWGATLPPKRQSREDITRAGRFVEFHGPSKQLRTVDVPAVSRWGHELIDEGKHPATVVRHRASLSALCRWAIQHGHIDSNPVLGSWCPKQPKEKMVPSTPAEKRALFAAVKGHRVLEPAYLLAYYAGLRRTEIAAAVWADVDLRKKTLFVRGSKTVKSEATLPIHKTLLKWLKANKGEPHEAICPREDGGTFHPQSLQNVRDGFPADLPPFHRGRHTIGCELAEKGVSIYQISEILRHTSVKTTERFYAHRFPASRGRELGFLE